YLEGALVRDSDDTQNAPEAPTGRRRDYVPSSEPGARLPHMSVRMLQTPTSKEILSTLDLVAGDKLEFLLIIAPNSKSYDLAKAGYRVAEGFQVSVKVCVMWCHRSSEGLNGSKAALVPWENFVDVEEVKKPLALSWWEICKMSDKGALLVRPDGHIAWRTKDEVLGDAVLQMENIFSQVLGVKNVHA
ncbi:FAD/NAD(P)-binding oxidoreductase family protein, partial [Thalictrum thalictroides]